MSKINVSQNTYALRLWAAGNISTRFAPEHIRPSEASIKLTENCQSRCVTCDYWKHRWKDSFSTDQAIQFITRLGEIGITTLRFTGGEPLLRRDLFQVLTSIDSAPFQTIGIQTNGLLLRKYAQTINDSPITHVSISLDGVGARNDAIRGIPGYFERALAGIQLLEEKTIIIAMTLNSLGTADLQELINIVQRYHGFLACNLPDNRLYFLNGAEITDLWPSEKDTENILDTLRTRLNRQFTSHELDYIGRYLHIGSPDNHVANPPCILGFTTLYISSDGALRSGCYALPPIGNVLETDIAELLRSQAYRERCMAMLRLECPGCACNVFKSLHYKHLVQDVTRYIVTGTSSNQS
jgi:MoaA/NifB/PqqE/SkfB family radical SAM enzyme